MQPGNDCANQSCSIIQIHKTDGTLFYPMVHDFLKRAMEYELSADLIIEQIIDAEGKWVIFNEKNEAKGYFFASIQRTEYRSLVVLVRQLYIAPEWGESGALRLTDSVLEQWGRQRGASEIAFYTRRNPKAFCKSLGNGWGVDSCVLKREIKP